MPKVSSFFQIYEFFERFLIIQWNIYVHYKKISLKSYEIFENRNPTLGNREDALWNKHKVNFGIKPLDIGGKP